MRKAPSTATLLIAGLTLSTYGIPSWHFHKAIRVYSDPEAYRVYAAILPDNPGYKYSSSTLIIREGTRYYYSDSCFEPGTKYEALVDSAIADYRRVNRVPWKLARLFPISKPYQFAPESDFAGFMWKTASPLGEYIRNHPDFAGYIELSAVGFNQAKTVAVVYTAYKGAGLSAGWDVVILRKEKGDWKELIGRGLGCFAKS